MTSYYEAHDLNAIINGYNLAAERMGKITVSAIAAESIKSGSPETAANGVSELLTAAEELHHFAIRITVAANELIVKRLKSGKTFEEGSDGEYDIKETLPGLLRMVRAYEQWKERDILV